jgi:two-component system, OmpR family, sensor kinase
VHFTDFGECVLVGRSIAAELKSLSQFRLLLLTVGAAVLAFGLGGGWWLATVAIRPIREISAAAERLAVGELAQRIPVPASGNELAPLAKVLNSTFSRLDAVFARQQQFTADAAHELRTPVSVILMHAQNGLAAACANEEHREAFESCLRASQRMRKLTETLLQLARMDSGKESMPRSSVDLVPLVQECVDLVQPIAVARAVTIRCELAFVMCAGDPERLGQVITNLLTNAIQYSKTAAEVRVSVRADGDMAVLSVADDGVGVPPEHLPHIFERFYRADTARTGGPVHAGLGLALVEAIVRAHRGTVTVESKEGVGSTFEVRIPAVSAKGP